MPVPKLIAEALHTAPSPYDSLAVEHSCEASKFHSPNPLLVARYALSANGVYPLEIDEVPTEPLETVWLCGTCVANIVVYLNLLIEAKGQLEWPLRREFGNAVRAIGTRAYKVNSNYHG